MNSDQNNFWSGSFRYMSKILKKSGPAVSASYALIGAILLLSFLGYMLDKFFTTDPWFLFIGIVTGLIVGFYELFKLTIIKKKK